LPGATRAKILICLQDKLALTADDLTTIGASALGRIEIIATGWAGHNPGHLSTNDEGANGPGA
jgi:hypothetical protein